MLSDMNDYEYITRYVKMFIYFHHLVWLIDWLAESDYMVD